LREGEVARAAEKVLLCVRKRFGWKWDGFVKYAPNHHPDRRFNHASRQTPFRFLRPDRFRRACGVRDRLLRRDDGIGRSRRPYRRDGVAATDLAGNPRVFGRAIDVGCYELQKNPGMLLIVR
jgi:hypothetical protein